MRSLQRPKHRWLWSIITITVVTLLLVTVGGVLYWRGVWVPNRPDLGPATVQGVDVSHHQGPIDWPTAAGAGVDFVYIKATEGADYTDPAFAANWRGSGTAGIRHGAYHFYRLHTDAEAQAAHFIATVPRESGSLPPAVDLEYSGNPGPLPGPFTFRVSLTAFLAHLRDHYGVEPVVYTDPDFHGAYLSGYPLPRLWIRYIFLTPTASPATPGHSGSIPSGGSYRASRAMWTGTCMPGRGMASPISYCRPPGSRIGRFKKGVMAWNRVRLGMIGATLGRTTLPEHSRGRICRATRVRFRA